MIKRAATASRRLACRSFCSRWQQSSGIYPTHESSQAKIRSRGEVVWFSPDKRCGKVFDEEMEHEIYFHQSNIKGFKNGMPVVDAHDLIEYKVVCSRTGFYEAKDVAYLGVSDWAPAELPDDYVMIDGQKGYPNKHLEKPPKYDTTPMFFLKQHKSN